LFTGGFREAPRRDGPWAEGDGVAGISDVPAAPVVDGMPDRGAAGWVSDEPAGLFASANAGAGTAVETPLPGAGDGGIGAASGANPAWTAVADVACGAYACRPGASGCVRMPLDAAAGFSVAPAAEVRCDERSRGLTCETCPAAGAVAFARATPSSASGVARSLSPAGVSSGFSAADGAHVEASFAAGCQLRSHWSWVAWLTADPADAVVACELCSQGYCGTVLPAAVAGDATGVSTAGAAAPCAGTPPGSVVDAGGPIGAECIAP
jgi:hypothetical protein